VIILSSYPTLGRRSLKAVLAHYLHGFIAGMFWWICPWLSAFLYVQFFLYELVEETKLKDEMYRELKEWAVGFLIGVLISFVWSIYGGLKL